MRVIVVDDELDFRESMIEILQMKGHEAFGVGSVVDYFNLPATTTFDLAVVDCLLVDGDSEKIISHIRRTKNARVVLVTGSVHFDSLKLPSEITPDLYIQKPFTVQPLLSYIAQLSA